MNKIKNICIIGAGIFGSTIALKLSKNANNKIDLIERERDILTGVSFKNQQRFHLGYHYPRSSKTIIEIKSSYREFIKFYGSRIFGKTKNFYLISNDNSKISFEKYKTLLDRNKLNFKIIENNSLIKNTKGIVEVPEKILNIFKFRKIIKKRIKKKNNINLILNKKKIDYKNITKNYDKIILCTYYNNNNLLENLQIPPKRIKKKQYEIIEKIIVKLPLKMANLSIVVMDGLFFNVDPFIGTRYHLLSAVKPSKILVRKNKKIVIPKKYQQLISLKYSKNIKFSRFADFIKISKKYIPEMDKAKYVKSFFTVRCVNISKNSHDRTNKIECFNNKIITVLSGKWNTCVSIAKKLEKMI